MNRNFSTRDKAILVGLFLSKFDNEALEAFGFESIKQAFNTLGYSVGTKPASIKNYRDEFDPYFPNPRKGWHKRQLRDYCKKFLDDFGDVNFDNFSELIKTFVIKDYAIEKFINKIEKKDYAETVAKRLVTGNAAEEYFRVNYNTVREFSDFQISDTTKLACGFDFKLSLDIEYFCIEVKGLNTKIGNVSMTEKEFYIADKLKEKYCLFIVSNFMETPSHQYIFDPLNSRLTFKKNERQVIQTTYNTQI